MSYQVTKDPRNGNNGPWLMDESNFSKSEDPVRITRILRYIKENHEPLTLLDEGDRVPRESLLININDGSLQIDKPLEWGDKDSPFRVFFRDQQRNWIFFPVSRVSASPFALSVAVPEALHYLQRRACPRVKVPIGTRALVKNGNQLMSTVFVHDLSASGMLMHNNPAEGEYAPESIINDIVVSIPHGRAAREKGNIRKVLPLIGQGRIVRSYVDPETHRPCYGVSFQYDSSYVRETINQIISEVEGDVGHSDFFC